jgi:riboflavin synthase
MKADGRLGGHFVLGHVDTRGRVDVFRPVGDSWELAITYDRQFDRLVIDKGSIAINGVSLTVNETKSGWSTINLIPHTVENTALKLLGSGSAVNLEFDMIGKYFARQAGNAAPQGLTFDKLKKNGW